MLEFAFRRALLQVLQPLDLPLDRLVVGERPAEPPLGDPEAPRPLRLGLDDELELFLGADEQNPVPAQHHRTHLLLRFLDLPQRLLEIDDVDARALGENEPAHLGIPAARLVPEMDTGFQQILQLRLRHALPFMGFRPPPPSLSQRPCHGRDPAPNQAACVFETSDVRHQTSGTDVRCLTSDISPTASRTGTASALQPVPASSVPPPAG